MNQVHILSSSNKGAQQPFVLNRISVLQLLFLYPTFSLRSTLNFCTLLVSFTCPLSHKRSTYINYNNIICTFNGNYLFVNHLNTEEKVASGNTAVICCGVLWLLEWGCKQSWCDVSFWDIIIWSSIYGEGESWNWAVVLDIPVRDVRTISSIRISVVYCYLDLRTKNKPNLKIKLMKYTKAKWQQSLGIEPKTPGLSHQCSITVLWQLDNHLLWQSLKVQVCYLKTHSI